uniref:long-chain-fatty-acid--CoA ligase n=1 Tax=Strigamia maritima TaxID=126957 RepID=T1JBW0_STRMM
MANSQLIQTKTFSITNEFVQNLIETHFEDLHIPEHQKGPDYIYPTSEPRTWLPDGKVRMTGSKDSKSVVTFFREIVKNNANKTAMVTKRNGFNVKWSYSQYLTDVNLVAKAFIKLGLSPYNGVCILGFNSPEWLISHLAAIFAGGLPAGVYTTNSPAACFHILQDCNANIVVVEDEHQLGKILKIRDTLPKLKTIIQYSGKPSHPDVISWPDLLKIGQSLPDDVLDKRIKSLAINQCCFLIYTSGTTGNPKGVMVSHDNVLAFAHFTTTKILEFKTNDRMISYLPLSHMAALGIDLYLAVQMAATVYFATPDALKGKMVDILHEVQPTVFLAVPRVIEKLYEKLQDAEVQMKPFKKSVFQWAQQKGINHHLKKSSNNMGYKLAKKLVFNKLKNQMGLQYITYIAAGGAPISSEIKRYFMGLDLIILDVYGLSESTGIHTGNTKNDFQLESVGNVNYIKEYKVDISNPSEDGSGEIILHGRNICMGYLHLKQQTIDIIDDEQWLFTGDLGMIDKYGYLYVTGRAKELIITSGGENIPPILIETIIKKNLPVVSNCMLVGDRKKYLTMLITLKTEVDPNTLLPTDELSQQAIAWCESVGSQIKSVSELIHTKDESVMRAIQDGITKYNHYEAISNAQKIQKWIILPEDFSIGNGDFGPTGKMRRPLITKKYSDLIDKMYAN